MVQTAQTLAELHGITENEIAAATTKNFEQLFGLGGC
jgi:Tat protein secretion system quality control protein TatD with DNase activity